MHLQRTVVPVAERGFNVQTEHPSWSGAIVVARGELDLAAAPALRRELTAAVDERRVLLDLSDVTFIDSVALSTVVVAHRRLGRTGRLAVVTTEPYVNLVIEACALDRVLTLFTDRDEAIGWLTR